MVYFQNEGYLPFEFEKPSDTFIYFQLNFVNIRSTYMHAKRNKNKSLGMKGGRL